MDKLSIFLKKQKQLYDIIKPYQDISNITTRYLELISSIQPRVPTFNDICIKNSILEHEKFLSSFPTYNFHTAFNTNILLSESKAQEITAIYENLNQIQSFVQSPIDNFLANSHDILNNLQNIFSSISSFELNIPDLTSINKSIDIFQNFTIQESYIEVQNDTYEEFLSIIHSDALEMPPKLENTTSEKIRLPIKTFIDYLMYIIAVVEFFITIYCFCVPDTSSQEILSIKQEELKIKQEQLKLQKEEFEFQKAHYEIDQKALEQLENISNQLVELKELLSDKYQNRSDTDVQKYLDLPFEQSTAPDETESR